MTITEAARTLEQLRAERDQRTHELRSHLDQLMADCQPTGEPRLVVSLGGPVAVGKGTVSKHIEAALVERGLPVTRVALGDEIRAGMSGKGEFAVIVRPFQDVMISGLLLPDEVALAIQMRRMFAAQTPAVILDGGERNAYQMQVTEENILPRMAEASGVLDFHNLTQYLNLPKCLERDESRRQAQGKRPDAGATEYRYKGEWLAVNARAIADSLQLKPHCAVAAETNKDLSFAISLRDNRPGLDLTLAGEHPDARDVPFMTFQYETPPADIRSWHRTLISGFRAKDQVGRAAATAISLSF